MAFYKHYSFDLWLTLIKSNPAYKQERTRYFYQRFNTKHKNLAEIAVIFRQVDLMVNAINERTGKNVDADEMYLMIISMINDYDFIFMMWICWRLITTWNNWFLPTCLCCIVIVH